MSLISPYTAPITMVEKFSMFNGPVNSTNFWSYMTRKTKKAWLVVKFRWSPRKRHWKCSPYSATEPVYKMRLTRCWDRTLTSASWLYIRRPQVLRSTNKFNQPHRKSLKWKTWSSLIVKCAQPINPIRIQRKRSALQQWVSQGKVSWSRLISKSTWTTTVVSWRRRRFTAHPLSIVVST